MKTSHIRRYFFIGLGNFVSYPVKKHDVQAISSLRVAKRAMHILL